MTKIRTATIESIHLSLGKTAELWPRSPSSLRQYALRAAPEHLWCAGRADTARSWLFDGATMKRQLLRFSKRWTCI